MFNKTEKRLILLLVVLCTLLCVVLAVIAVVKWQRQPERTMTSVQAETSIAPVIPDLVQPTALTHTTEPPTQWTQVPEATLQPMPEEVRIEVNKNMRIQAMRETDSEISAVEGEVTFAHFDRDAAANILFQDNQSSRNVKKLEDGEGLRYDITNDTGEYLMIVDGRFSYSYRDELAWQYRELTQHLTETSRGKWLYKDREALKQELDYMSREDAARLAENTIASVLGENTQYSVKAERIYACTFAELEAFEQQFRGDSSWRYSYDHRPGMEDGGNKGDGVYRVDLRLYYQGVPCYSDNLEFDSSVNGNSAVASFTDSSAVVLLTAQGVLHCQMKYYTMPISSLRNASVLTFDEAVERFVQIYTDVISPESVVIEQIQLRYVVMRRGEGDSARFFLQPVWCFAAENRSGKPEDRNFYYIDAITGEELSKS